MEEEEVKVQLLNTVAETLMIYTLPHYRAVLVEMYAEEELPTLS